MDPTVDSAKTGALAAPWDAARAHSHYLRGLLDGRPEIGCWLAGHLASPLDGEQMSAFLAAETTSTDEQLKGALRRLRQRVMSALIVRDIGGVAPLAEVVESMTLLAELTTNFALDFFHRQLAAQFGEPLDSQGQAQRLLVVGMGKLGERRLRPAGRFARFARALLHRPGARMGALRLDQGEGAQSGSQSPGALGTGAARHSPLVRLSQVP